MAKTELEDAGLETDGMVESTAKLRDLIKGISGVDIMLDENTFKSTYQIIEELGKVWNSIKDVDQASLLEAIAGKRQSNIVAAALTNYDRLDDVLQTSINSMGSARAEQEEYAKSIQYSIDTFKAAYQDFAQTVIGSEFTQNILGGAQKFLEILTKIVEVFGSFPTLMAGLGATLSITKGVGVFGSIVDETNSANKQITLFGKTFKEIQNDIKSSDTKGLAKITGALKSTGAQAVATEIKVTALNAALSFGLSLAVSLLVQGIGKLVDKLIVTEEELNEVRQNSIDTSNALRDSTESFVQEAESIEELVAQYKQIALSIDTTVDARDKLSQIQTDLIDKFGEEAKGLDLVNGKYDEQLQKIDELSKAQYEQWRIENADKIKEAEKVIGYNVGWVHEDENGKLSEQVEGANQVYLKGWVDHTDDLAASLYKIEDVSEDIQDIYQNIAGIDFVDGFFSNDIFLSGTVEDAKNQLEQLIQAYSQLENVDMGTLAKLTKQYNYLNTELKNAEYYMSEINSYETPNQEAQQLKEYENRLAEVQSEIAEKNIDVNKTVFGNIDTNSRQLLTWTKENLRKYSEAIESWGFTNKELADSVSTVMGTSSEYDGVEIAFSPILQTKEGAVLLTKNTVDKYIWGLIEEAGEGWTTEQLLKLDTEGLEIDGQKVKNLLADIGETAIATGEAMHYVGKNGALAMAEKDVNRFKKGIYDVSTESINALKGITVSLREEWFTALTETQNGTTKAVDTMTSALQTLANGDGLSSADFWNLMELDTHKILTDIKMVGDGFVLNQEQLIKFKDEYIKQQVESLRLDNQNLATKQEDLKVTLEQAKAELSILGARGMSNAAYREQYQKAYESIKQGEKNLADYGDQIKWNNILIDQWNAKLGDTTDKTKQLQEQQKKLTDEVSKLNNELDDYQKAYEYVIDNIIDGLNDELDVLDEQKQTLQDELDALNEQKDAIEDIINNYDTVNKLVQDTVEKRKEELEAEKKSIEDSYNERINKLKEENEEREDALEYAQKLANLENARNNKRRVLDETRGWRYESVKEDVVTAENDLASFENEQAVKALEKERDEQIKRIDDIIKSETEYSELWKEISEEVQTEEQELLAEQILGTDWREKIANHDIEIISKFRTEYRAHNVELQRITGTEIKLKQAAIEAKDAEIKAKQAQIKEWQNYKKEVQDAVKDIKNAQEDYMKLVGDIQLNENSSLTDRANNFETFKNRVTGYINDIAEKQSALEGVNAELDRLKENGDINISIEGLDDIRTFVEGIGTVSEKMAEYIEKMGEMPTINSPGDAKYWQAAGYKQYSAPQKLTAPTPKIYSAPPPITNSSTSNTNSSLSIGAINVYANNPTELSRGLDKELDKYFRTKLTQSYTQK